MIWKKQVTTPYIDPYAIFTEEEQTRIRHIVVNNVRGLDHLVLNGRCKAIPGRQIHRRKNGVIEGGYLILLDPAEPEGEPQWVRIDVTPRGMGCFKIDFLADEFQRIWREVRKAEKYLASKIEMKEPVRPVLPESTITMLEQTVFDFYRAIDHLETTRGFGNVGLIFTGPPGVGKSETMRWIRERAHEEFKRGCFHLGLAELNEALTQCKPLNSNSALFFIDDIDSNLLRDRRKTNNPLTSQFLTCLDGMHKSEGRVMVVSTNEKINSEIDPALLRPGRFDHVIEFTYPDLSLIAEFCERRNLDLDPAMFTGWSFARIDMFLAKFKVAEYMRDATLAGYYEQFTHELGATDPIVEREQQEAETYDGEGWK